MSLALDVALFLRNSKTKLGLSMSARGMLLTLAHRVGSKDSTWVSHNTLALEFGMHKQNLTEPMQKIVKTGILKSKSNKIDKRKRLYSFPEIIKNYHQKSDSDKQLIHEAFGDTMILPVDKSKNRSGKPELNLGNSSGKPELYSSGKPERLLNDKSPESHATYGLQENQKSPKATYKSNNKNKESYKRSVNLTKISEDFFPDDKRLEALHYHAKRTNNATHELLTKFIAVSKKYKTRSSDWQNTFDQFLTNEMPKRTYENNKGQRIRYDGSRPDGYNINY